jgi:hypothetical protein
MWLFVENIVLFSLISSSPDYLQFPFNLTPPSAPLSLPRRGELAVPTPPREWGLGAGGEVFYSKSLTELDITA